MLEAFGLSDPGCLRANNEDYFINDSFRGVFIVADGMGGANAGEYASRLSAETLYEYLVGLNGSASPRGLEDGFHRANDAVKRASAGEPALEGMGTTLVAARVIADRELQLASVGDSRAYRFSRNELSVLTEDHTWVKEVGSRLGLSDEALKKHPMRHVLTMAIGVSEDVRVDVQTVFLSQGDQILLCSDGLHGVVDENTLETAMRLEKSLPEKAHYLIEAARGLGAPDNVTVVLVQVL